MAAAPEPGVNRMIENDEIVPAPANPQQMNAILGAPEAQQDAPELGWLADLPEARVNVPECLIWPKLDGGWADVALG